MKKMGWMLLLLLLLGSGVGARVSAQEPDDCTPTPKDELHVQTFESKIFGDTQTLRVWLPPGYDDPANAKRVYSVLYMMDGGGNFSGCKDGHVNGWQIDRTLTRLIAAGSVEPIIVVAIDAGKGKGRRAEEYVPFVVHDGGPNVQGDLFPDFMVKEVLPLIAAAGTSWHRRLVVRLGGSAEYADQAAGRVRVGTVGEHFVAGGQRRNAGPHQVAEARPGPRVDRCRRCRSWKRLADEYQLREVLKGTRREHGSGEKPSQGVVYGDA